MLSRLGSMLRLAKAWCGVRMCVLFLTLWWCLPGAAQVTLDGSLGPRLPRPLEGPRYVIDASLGDRRGGNLFHSFGRFSLRAGEQAVFTGPLDVTNILGRVTGGEVSRIDGTIRSEIPGANVFLLNSAGMLFGPHASLEVSGAFYASTADYIRFGAEERFMATMSPLPGELRVPSPVAFGFLGPQAPQAITVDGSALRVLTGETIGLVGGKLTLTGQGELSFDHPTLTALGGRIHLASVAAAGEVPLLTHDAATAGALTTVERFGAVLIRNGALLEASGDDGGGMVLIQAGRLHLLHGSGIATDTLGAGNGAALGVDIRVQDDMLVYDSFIESGVFAGASGNAGDVRITAGSLTVMGGDGFVGSPSQDGATGARGNVVITTTGRLVVDAGSIDTNTQDSGAGGAITITAGQIDVRGGGRIASDGLRGSGAIREDVVITTGTLLLTGAGSRIGTNTQGGGEAGDVRITANRLDIRDEASISSTALRDATGKRGDIHLMAGRLVVTEGASIDTSTAGTTRQGGGNIFITATQSLTVSSPGDRAEDKQSSILSRTSGVDDAGRLSILAPTILLEDGAIRAITLGEDSGNAGEIVVQATRLRLDRGAQISSSTFGSGAGGTVTVHATEALTIRGQNALGERSALASTAQAGSSGAGGKVVVNAAEASVTLEARGAISAQTSGSGDAGDIQVEARRLSIQSGAQIDSNTSGAGKAGNVMLAVQQDLNVAGRDRTGLQSRIASSSQRRDDGGPVGQGGRLMIQAGSVLLNDGLIQVVTETASNAGAVEMTTGHLTLLGGAEITSSTTGAGHGGTVTIEATQAVTILGRGMNGTPSQLVSTTTSGGTGGNLAVQAPLIELGAGGRMAADSTGSGNAGTIAIRATEQFRSQGSSITTTAAIAGGGNITISAPLVSVIDSRLTAEAGGASQRGSDGGNVTIQAGRVVLNRSVVLADAFGGNGGNININATEVFLADAVTCDQGQCLSASSALGVDGTVEISSPVTNVSGTLAPLSQTFSSEAVLSRDRCAGRHSGGGSSQFVLSGRDGVPVEPGYVLPSPFYAGEKLPVGTEAGQKKSARAQRQQGVSFAQAGAQVALASECLLWHGEEKTTPLRSR